MADNRKLGIIQISKLKEAPQLMMGNQYLTSVNCPFPELTNGSGMFRDCSNLTSFTSTNLGKLQNGSEFLYGTKISQFTTDLPSLTNADMMFEDCKSLTTVISNMPLLGSGGSNKTLTLPNGVTTFEGSLESVTLFKLPANIQTFKGSLRSLTSGSSLFYDTSANSLRVFESDLSSVEYFGDKKFPSSLTTFNASLSGLKNGNNLFSNCSQMTSLNVGSLTSLNQGVSMFSGCRGIGSWELDMKALKNGSGMFSGCNELTYFNSHIGVMTDGSEMFVSDQKLQTAYVHLASLTNGTRMFYYCTALENFTQSASEGQTVHAVDLGKLEDGTQMFTSCTSLKTFYSTLPSLKNGYRMFESTGLTSFSQGTMDELVNGTRMFDGCSSLKSVEISAAKLVDASEMFKNTSALTNTSYDTVSSSIKIINNYGTLSNAAGMFAYSSIASFSEANCSLTSVKNGKDMFYKCGNLASFTGKLNSLLTGHLMFCDCKLDSNSLNYIKSYINDISSYIEWPEVDDASPVFKGSETWQYDCWTDTPTATVTEGDGESTTNITKVTIPEDQRGRIHVDFAESVTDNEKTAFKAELLAKGWKVDSCVEIPVSGMYNISVDSKIINESDGVANVTKWRSESYDVYELHITSITYDGTDGVMNGTDKFDRK